MKSLFYFLFFVNVLFASSSTLKIAITTNMTPYTFYDENNKVQGIFVDYWKLWAKKTNRKIEFVPSSWSQTLKNLKNNEVDIHSGLFINEQRKEYIKFIEPLTKTSSEIFVKVKNSKKIITINDLENKTLGLLNNSYYHSYIKNNFPKIRIKAYDNYQDIIDAFFSEELDAIMDETLVIWFQIVKRYKHNEVTKIKDFTINNWFYAGINKLKNINNNEKLETLIKKGMNLISNEELLIIKNKWQINNNLNFYKREKIIFTQEELDYIKNSPVLKVSLETWKPIIFNENNQLKGIAGEILTKTFKTSGLKVEFVHDTWSNLLKKFEEKKIDILPTTSFTKKRSKYGLFSNSYLTLNNFLYTKDTNKSINSFKDLNNKKLALEKNFASIDFINKKFPKIKIVQTNSLDESIQKVLNGEADALFETQIIVQNKIKELMLTNLKEVSQSDIKPYGLHIFSKNKDFLLQSILQKSLNNISGKEKNLILDKWLKRKENKEFNVAFGKNKEPYAISKAYLKGIEYDLITEILKLNQNSIKNITMLPYDKLQNALKNDNTLDFVVAVKEKNDGYFYSDDFISFENVIISRREDNLNFKNIKDLENKKIIAFKDAYKYLGKEYFELFNSKNRTSLYKEYVNEEKQIQSFLDKKTDLLILDKNIFLWNLKKLAHNDENEYKFDYLFPKKNTYKVAFRDEYVRNIFNKNLKVLKKNQRIKNVFSNYINKDIEAKVKINSFISSVVSRFIFTEEIDKLDKIIEKLTNLKYINKIEVFNDKNILLSSSSKKPLTNYMLYDSHYLIFNIPRKVGYIKVYFDEEELIKYSKDELMIPKLDFFKNLSSYSYIKEVYKRFKYLKKEIIFSKKEQLFIKNNPMIKFSAGKWPPFSIIKENTFSGISNEYIKILENKTKLNFTYVKPKSWVDVLNKFNNNEIDLIPSVSNTKSIQDMGNLSKSFLKFNFVIVGNEKSSFTNGLKGLNGKTVALPKKFTSNIIIKSKYPKIKVIDTNSIEEALTMLSQGKVDAFVGHEAATVYQIKKYYKNLKIIGFAKEEYKHFMLINKDKTELLSIVNKVISSITQKQKDEINDKWIKLKINTEIDYTILYKIVAVFTLILLIILYFTKKLSLAKNSIEITNKRLNENILEVNNIKEELEVSLENLKLTQKKLIDSEKMASLGGLVAGIAHEINTPIGIGLTGSSHFLEITNNIIKKFDNENMSRNDFIEYTSDSSELANLIYTNLHRTSHLIKSFKQISVDQSSEQKRVFRLKNYIKEILLSINNIVKKTNINVIIKAEKEISLNSYPGAISQIITNLVFNSLNHAYEENEHGEILISLKTEKENTLIIYEDNGKGISSENLPKIFDPFFTTNRNKGGTGLGLNIIYNIVTTQLNGAITCNSIEKSGVKFIIKL